MTSPATRASLLLRLRDVTDSNGAAHAAAWAEFVRIYGPQVLAWCRGCGLQESDAADVCQDVLVRFWKQSARFEYDPKRRFRGYLRQVLRTALSGWSAGRRPDAATEEMESVLDSLPAREELMQRIEAAYDTEVLTAAIDDVKTRVKPHTWRAFEIVAFERRTGHEAAEELGISTDLVYSARRNVQKMLQETVARLEGGVATA